MIDIVKLLKEGKDKGVKVFLDENGSLKLGKEKDALLDAAFLERLKNNREEIIAFLKKEANHSLKTAEQQVIPVKYQSDDARRVLSFAQERLWFVDKMEGSTHYHLQGILKLKGRLDKDALHRALTTIVNRHSSLRSIIVEEDTLFQQLLAKDSWTLEQINVANKQEVEVEELMNTIASRPFNLSKDHRLKAYLLTRTNEEHLLLLVFHHIATDAWSDSIFVKELIALYQAEKTGVEANLPTLSIQYADFAIWEREQLSGESYEAQLAYWKTKLDGFEILHLPKDSLEPKTSTKHGNNISYTLDENRSRQLHQLAQENGVSLFMLLLAVYKVLLYRYCNQRDICVGTSFANRSNKQVEPLIGLFVKLLPLRTQLEGNPSFVAFLNEVKQTVLNAFANKDVPFNKIVEAVGGANLEQNPIFQTLFVHNSTTTVKSFLLDDVEVEVASSNTAMTHFDLCFYINESEKGINISINYFTSLFNESTILKIQSYYLQLLQSILDDPTANIGSLQIMATSEKEKLIHDTLQLSLPYPKEKSMKVLFEEQAEQTPDAIAATHVNESLTYLALNQQANYIANKLKENYPIEPNDLLGILMENPLKHLVAMLAIWKTGAAYVPLDTEIPKARLNFIIKDTALKVLLTEEVVLDQIQFETPTYLLHDFTNEQVENPVLDEPFVCQNLAYVIYTSGTTGKPKGVKISHQNLTDYIFGLNARIGIHTCRSFAFMSSISADLGNTVLYASLLSGGELHLFQKAALTNPTYLHEYFAKHSIDCIKIVPSHWQALELDQQCLLPKQLIVFGGEVLTTAIVEKIENTANAVRIVNHYGPTETTIGKLLHEIDFNKQYGEIPIGTVFSNTKAYVANDELALCPVGTSGELLIGGDGISSGYLNRPALTMERFIDNPFASEPNKLYRTGDLVRMLPNGDIVFIGRMDDQVKIRGYRVELREIQMNLEECPLVKRAIVLAKNDSNGKQQLIAYLIPEETFDKTGIQDYLKDNLPEYMIPTLLVEMEAFPLNANGKIDRKQLPDPDIAGLHVTQFVAPRNDLERSIAEIWMERLKLDKVGIHDDFFELGGHSLLAIRMVLSFRKKLKQKIDIKDVFDYPTIASLADFMSEEVEEFTLPVITAKKRPARIAVSDAQKRLWTIDQLEGSTNYHIHHLQRFHNDLNIDAFESAMNELINRHEILRTVFYEVGEEVYQKVMPEDKWEMKVDELKKPMSSDQIRSIIHEETNKAFDLSAEHMIRARLLRLDSESYLLVLVVHHIAIDGWSIDVLTSDLLELYRAKVEGRPNTLKPLSIQYADYAIWQQTFFDQKIEDQQLAYWNEKLKGAPLLELPNDHPHTNIQDAKGAEIKFKADAVLTQQLRQVCKQEGVTLYMLILAALKVLMSKYSGQTDICIGSTIANRNQKELEGLIGFFLNAFALRTDLGEATTFKEYLKQVKTTTLEAYKNHNVSFEKVLNSLSLKREGRRSPLFQIWYDLHENANLHGKGKDALNANSDLLLDLEDHFYGAYIPSKFDLDFIVLAEEDEIAFNVIYRADLFSKERMDRMSVHLVNVLQSIVEATQQKISSINILSEQERQCLIDSFNDTNVVYPSLESSTEKGKTYLDLFRERVDHDPDQPALVFQNETLSYLELDKKSDQLAQYLRNNHDLKTEGLIGLMMEKSAWSIISILGIQKAGCAYVPIDMEYPADRKRFIVEDTNLQLLIIDSSNILSASEYKVDLLCLDLQFDDFEEADQLLDYTLDAKQLAYVIYTSGTSGRPKGVMIEHSGLVNMALALMKSFYIKQTSKTLQFSSLSFDASCAEIFPTLVAGGTLIIPEKEDVLKPEQLSQFLLKQKVTTAIIPPSFQPVVKDYLGSLKTLISAGEAMNTSVMKEINEKGVRIINAYGPTENTVCITSTDEPIIQDNLVTIGKPIDNVQVYILGPNKELLPYGVPGEICVGGQQVGRGYLNRPELTKEKFVQDPFHKNPNAKLYRTGDKGYWLASGEIVYIGRTDEQVKIRGYRIELGEIEANLSQCPEVKQATVQVIKDSNDHKQLVAYFVGIDKANKTAIQNYLKANLPDYMVPSILIEMDRLPLTVNGKVDKRALPEPSISDLTSRAYTAPTSTAEKQLAEIWKDLFGLERIGIHDNFFELGGDSITSIQMVSKAKRIGLVFQAKDVFECYTIDALLKRINPVTTTLLGNQGRLEGAVKLSPIQQWFFEKECIDKTHYNQSVLLEIDKTITAEMLSTLVEELWDQHDALRLNYAFVDGEWQQHFGASSIQLDIETIADGKENFAKQITSICQHYHTSLDFEKRQLSKVVLIQTPASERNNRLFFVAHHLLVDGVSWRILLDQFQVHLATLIKGESITLGVKTSSYRQWVEALEKYTISDSINAHKSYWQNTSLAYTPLPTDILSADMPKVNSQVKFTTHLDKEETKNLLTEVHSSYQTNIQDYLIAALAQTISAWTGENKIVVGLEGHGREYLEKGVDLTETIGWFTSVYPLLLKVDEAALIPSIKEQIRSVPQKGLTYGLLRYLHSDVDVRSELSGGKWDILFNYLGQTDQILQVGDLLRYASESKGEAITDSFPMPYKLVVNAIVNDGQLKLTWAYSTQQYNEGTIERLAASYLQNLRNLIEESQQHLEKEQTPSDFGLVPEVTYQELKQFLTKENEKSVDGIQELYRLSALQEGMLFHHLFAEDDSPTYLQQIRLDFPEGVDVKALELSFNHVLSQHTILRSSFVSAEFSIPVQCVYRKVNLSFDSLDLTALDKKEQHQKYTEFLQKDAAQAFDFLLPPLMRVCMIKLSETHFKMIWTSHHIILDGWSISALFGDIMDAYDACVQRQTPPRKEEDQYNDYIKYIAQSKSKYEEERFWKNYLQPIKEGALLPFASRTIGRNKKGKVIGKKELILSSETTDQLQQFAQEHHLTINTIIQGLWAILLARYTGKSDVVFGVTVSGRPADLSGVEEKIGLYINTIPLGISIDKEQTVLECFKAIQDGHSQAREYQYSALNAIQRWCGISGDFFDSLLVFENYFVEDGLAQKSQKLKVKKEKTQEQTNYLLGIKFFQAAGLHIEFDYQSDLLEEAYVNVIKDHFEEAIAQLLLQSNPKVGAFTCIAANEKQKLIHTFNQFREVYPSDKTIVDLFTEQVRNHPEQTALIFKDQEWSYQELDYRSNVLAAYLKNEKIGGIVGHCFDKSAEMIVAILGILKAGAAYVPIDPVYPKQRIDYILKDTEVNTILTLEKHQTLFKSESQRTISLDSDWKDIINGRDSHFIPDGNVEDLAYIIYTSGTSGNPKGVLVQHKNLVNLSLAQIDGFGLSPQDKTLQFSSLGFDASCSEIFTTLLSGGTLVIPTKEDILDSDRLGRFIVDHKIDIATLPPSYQVVMKEHLRSLKKLVSAGEQLNTTLTQELRSAGVKVFNAYGPTENTVCISLTSDPILKNGDITIGKPLTNVQVYIVDEEMNLLPIGVVGEIVVGGKQVAQGYLNRPDLTSEKFVEAPVWLKQNGPLYKTGDFGRWHPDGNIIYLGRQDDQVKIRGYRIELGEVEHTLLDCPLVKQAVVVADYSNDQNPQLLAYVISEQTFDQELIQQFLATRLPNYMMPYLIMEITAFPLTSSGKVDRKALPKPDVFAIQKAAYAAPRNEMEKELVDIWKSLLGITQVGIHNNFFELGGHSLLATRLVAAIRKKMDINIPVNIIYEYTTIAALQKYIRIVKQDTSEVEGGTKMIEI